MGRNSILEVKNLKVYYKTVFGDARVVDDVSFTVYRSEIFGIAGESGCGKSTLVEGIYRLVKPPGYIAGGEVLFEGADLLKLSENEMREIRWKKIAYIPQGAMSSLNPVLRVEEQMIDAIIDHSDVSREEALEIARRALSELGLPEMVLRMYPHELSGGMKQRVIIATAYALHPELIIADEPVTALDVVSSREVLQTLSELRDRHGTTVILVAHDMAVHAEVDDRLAVMYAGKIIEVGKVDKVFYDPLHPYTKGLIDSIPSIAKKKMIKGIPGIAPSPLNWPPGCRFHPRCPYSKDVCRSEAPELKEVKPGHLVACHLYAGD
ncbi:MAG: ABC transporter ATP-binding protein [Thermofilum sp.]|jgi:peptide/nickel transport system ATP-binding protein|nr:ABC transporter ATP-binding protein [Thermofilum sp.]MCC6064690.1 ABC transporter ATP-binding protein [Thermofilum sp.]